MLPQLFQTLKSKYSTSEEKIQLLKNIFPIIIIFFGFYFFCMHNSGIVNETLLFKPRPSALQRVNINHIIIKYIPLGTHRSEVKKILKAHWFTVVDSPEDNPGIACNKCSLFARYEPLFSIFDVSFINGKVDKIDAIYIKSSLDL
jgi:hypothetical protein